MPGQAPEFSIIGAGLAGSLLAVELAQRGHRVSIHERNPDPRRHDVPAGRSINLALAERGRAALRRAGLLERVEAFSLPMAGRMLHDRSGETRFQRYGQRDDEVIWSVHRCELNKALLDATEECSVEMTFEQTLEGIDFAQQRLHLTDSAGQARSIPAGLIIGADGAGSAVRRAMARARPMAIREAPLGHGYRELTIPPDADGNFQLDPGALHIWPRGGFMMIALPNPDRSFTCTLFLAREPEDAGQPSFAGLAEPEAMRAFLTREFPDAVELITDLERELNDRPVGFLGTLYVDPWQHQDRAILIGDAAHAIVPFHGQGMNSAFEDARFLVDHLDAHGPTAAALERFFRARKPNADAIAAMALENYVEMRDQVRDPRFHLIKELAWALEKRLGDDFIPRYQMVMFRADIPYAEAQQRGDRQRALLERLVAGKSSLDEIDLDAACDQARALEAA
jgi:kynurenine 3-monooxygenase